MMGAPPAARRAPPVPSGLKATLPMQRADTKRLATSRPVAFAGEHQGGLTGHRSPDKRPALHPARGGQVADRGEPLSVGAEGDAGRLANLAGEEGALLGGRVPDLDGPVSAGNEAAVQA